MIPCLQPFEWEAVFDFIIKDNNVFDLGISQFNTFVLNSIGIKYIEDVSVATITSGQALKNLILEETTPNQALKLITDLLSYYDLKIKGSWTDIESACLHGNVKISTVNALINKASANLKLISNSSLTSSDPASDGTPVSAKELISSLYKKNDLKFKTEKARLVEAANKAFLCIVLEPEKSIENILREILRNLIADFKELLQGVVKQPGDLSDWRKCIVEAISIDLTEESYFELDPADPDFFSQNYIGDFKLIDGSVISLGFDVHHLPEYELQTRIRNGLSAYIKESIKLARRTSPESYNLWADIAVNRDKLADQLGEMLITATRRLAIDIESQQYCNKNKSTLKKDVSGTSGKLSRGRKLTSDQEEMIAVAINWMTDNPSKNSTAAADAIMTRKNNLKKWPKGYDKSDSLRRAIDRKLKEAPNIDTVKSDKV